MVLSELEYNDTDHNGGHYKNTCRSDADTQLPFDDASLHGVWPGLNGDSCASKVR